MYKYMYITRKENAEIGQINAAQFQNAQQNNM